ncbi:hypothetical protein FRB99_002669, partial [Tulasnella sp. 403]
TCLPTRVNNHINANGANDASLSVATWSGTTRLARKGRRNRPLDPRSRVHDPLYPNSPLVPTLTTLLPNQSRLSPLTMTPLTLTPLPPSS